MKKLKFLFLTFIFALVFTGLISNNYVFAQNSIRVFMDKDEVKFEVQPIIENGTTLVQFRPIFEKLGLSVGWDGIKNVVSGEKTGLKIQLTIGDNIAYINGKELQLDAAPKIIEGNTFVPLRFVGEASGGNVLWDGRYNLVNIYFDPALALHKAAGINDIQLIEKLVPTKADVNVKNAGFTPLMTAVWSGSTDSVKKLLEKGADVSLKSEKEGWTALDIATNVKPNNEIINILENYRNNPINPNTKSNDKLFTLSWGMSEAEVKATRIEKPLSERKDNKGNNQIVYDHTFETGEKGKVGYTFDATGLFECIYSTDSTSEFDDVFGVYTGLDMDLSYLYNNGNGPDDFKWKVDNIKISAYKKVYGNDFAGMAEMAIRSNDLSLIAEFKNNSSTIKLSMFNSGSFSKPDYIVGLIYTKK
ncbi:stalk domain-containing protein [Paenibacillus ferrarius]|uniref:stalk domain-containing protein n=1 Tax=Paenibacillus ferrarius TaxID=1469647 RepID=UPI003D2A2305